MVDNPWSTPKQYKIQQRQRPELLSYSVGYSLDYKTSDNQIKILTDQHCESASFTACQKL